LERPRRALVWFSRCAPRTCNCVAEIEALKAKKTPREHGLETWTKRKEKQLEAPWRVYVRNECALRKLYAASNADIYASFNRWTFVGRARPKRSVFNDFLTKVLRADGTLDPVPPHKRK
jgi:hypothetical protein